MSQSCGTNHRGIHAHVDRAVFLEDFTSVGCLVVEGDVCA